VPRQPFATAAVATITAIATAAVATITAIATAAVTTITAIATVATTGQGDGTGYTCQCKKSPSRVF
jgi:hypothetical protein